MPVQRVPCGECGKTTQVAVAWARAGSCFTQLFEALVLTLCREMPVNTMPAGLGLSEDSIWRILDYYVEAARAQAN